MPIFNFETRNKEGALISGERQAESADILGTQLLNEGLTPIKITLKKETQLTFPFIRKIFKKNQVSNSELALFTRQMYTLNKSGVSISSAMKQLSKTSRSNRMTVVLAGIAHQLESGQNLATAMEQYSDVFPHLVIAMVRIGQNTGQLDNAFLRLTEYLELEGDTIKRVKAAIRYPIFVVAAIIIGIIIINIFVIPAFTRVYIRSNIPLPFITAVLVSFSNFLLNYWIYLLLGLILIYILIRQYFNSPKGKYLWHKWQLKIPIIGHLLRRIILLRFSETFAIIINAGIPINEGLSLVAQSVENHYARDEVLKMQDAIQRGSSIVQAAVTCKLFTGLELQMLAISEETGELGTMLNEIALYYQREVDYDLKHITDIIEPLLLTGISLMVLFLALAVYMPIWSMVKLVNKG